MYSQQMQRLNRILGPGTVSIDCARTKLAAEKNRIEREIAVIDGVLENLDRFLG